MIRGSLQLSPLQIAEQKIPRHWYESFDESCEWTIRAMTVGLGLSVIACPVSIATEGSYPLYFHLISGALYTLSILSDGISTVRGLNAINKASLAGIRHYGHEDNPSLSHVRTTKEFLCHPMLYVSALSGLALATAIPGLGIPLLGIKTAAALSNFRLARRLNLATRIAQSRRSTLGVDLY